MSLSPAIVWKFSELSNLPWQEFGVAFAYESSMVVDTGGFGGACFYANVGDTLFFRGGGFSRTAGITTTATTNTIGTLPVADRPPSNRSMPASAVTTGLTSTTCSIRIGSNGVLQVRPNPGETLRGVGINGIQMVAMF